MMENGTTKTLECPQGFQQVSIDSSQLYFEDLDENSELWLVRMPKCSNVSSLENQRINIDGETYSVTAEDGTPYDCVADRRQIPNLCLLLPQTESKELSCVQKTFQGSIYINEVSARCIPRIKVEQSDLSIADLSLAVNSSMDVDSSEAPRKKKKKSHKKSKELSSNGFKEEPSSDLDGFPSCRSQTR